MSLNNCGCLIKWSPNTLGFFLGGGMGRLKRNGPRAIGMIVKARTCLVYSQPGFQSQNNLWFPEFC